MQNKSWNSGWNKVFRKYEWGKYPSEPLIRFIGKNYKKSINNKKLKVLEIGCGTGANLWYLSKQSFQTYGVDGSSVALAKAKKLLKEHNANSELIKTDIIKLPFPNEYFDLIIDIECLYSNSFAKSKIILNEINRVLKKNGKFFSLSFSTKTTGYNTGKRYKDEKNTFINLKKGPLKNDYGLIRFMNKSDIKKLYNIFSIVNLEKVSRTYDNLSCLIEEWIIISKK